MNIQWLSAFASLLVTASLSASDKLLVDTWEDLSTKSTIQDAPKWDMLNPDGRLEFIKTDEGMAMRLSKEMKLRSHAVCPYHSPIELKLAMRLENGLGAGGIGFIDFSSGLYFYLYADAENGKLVLQRGGDLKEMKLFEEEMEIGDRLRTYQLSIIVPENGQPVFTITVDGEVVSENVADPSTVSLGNTFQLYLGASSSARMQIHETTAVRAPAARSKSWFW